MGTYAIGFFFSQLCRGSRIVYASELVLICVRLRLNQEATGAVKGVNFMPDGTPYKGSGSYSHTHLGHLTFTKQQL